MIEVFSISKVENLGGGKWLLQGRAYDDVRLGDSLFVKSLVGDPAGIPLRVIEIFSYQKQTTELSRMMTGDLVVQADQDASLESAVTVFRKDGASD